MTRQTIGLCVRLAEYLLIMFRLFLWPYGIAVLAHLTALWLANRLP